MEMTVICKLINFIYIQYINALFMNVNAYFHVLFTSGYAILKVLNK